MNRLKGKVVLVSGGGADGPAKAGEDLPIGNGRAIAILCGREGAEVMVADRSLELGRQTARAITAEGGRAEAIAADVADEEACRHAVEAAVAKFGKLNLLVNSVGISSTSENFSASSAEFDRIIGVNLRGHFLMMKYGIPEMIKAGGGAIVNISSSAGVRGGAPFYGAAKSGILGLTRAAALQHARHKIRANTVIPGLIDSTMARRLEPQGRDERVSPVIPLQRQGTPWEIASAVVFLLSDEASYITATELVVDGGVIATLPGAPA